MIPFWAWLNGSSNSTNRRILGTAATIGLLTIVGKIFALGKDTAVAYSFGTSDAVDAFLIALLLPTLAINVVAGSLNAAFISVLIECRERRGARAAADLFQSVLTLSSVLLAAAMLLLVAGRGLILPYLALGFTPEKLAETHHLFLLLLPAVFLSGMSTVYTGALNAGERFALGALAPAVVPLTTLVAIVTLGQRIGIQSLAAGTVIGYGVHATVVAVAVRRTGFPVVPGWRGWTPDISRVVAQYLPVMAGASLLSSTGLVDQAMASMLPSGSVAALGYGNKVISMVTSLGTAALGTAILPHFSKMAAHAQWPELRRSVAMWTRLVLAVTVPATVVLIAASPIIVRSVFEWGAFTQRDTSSVSFVQVMYLFQVPFYALGVLFVRTLTSLQRNQVLLWGNLISFPLNLALNLLFMRWMGPAGIALSTSVVYAVSCGYLGLALRRALSQVTVTSVAIQAHDMRPVEAPSL